MRLPRFASAATTIMAFASMACVSGLVITFTGNVVNDFPAANPGVFVTGPSTSTIEFQGNRAGWQIDDVRFAYDFASDTGYFGMWSCCAVEGRALTRTTKPCLGVLFSQALTRAPASWVIPTATATLV